jgi:hypothetical protein
MGAAFGDSDTDKIVAEDHKEAKLYSDTAAKDLDDTEEFWGEEDPSDIDREFTVEGIPMTSALGENMEQASLNKVDTLKETKLAGSKNKVDSAKSDQSSVVKESHVATTATKSETGSTLASTSHRRSRHLSQEEMCDSVSALDFSGATVTHSNLGGAGPDSGEETLVYSGITNQDGFVVDLVVTATSPYQPRDASKNGLQDEFGVINLEINSAVDLLFRFMSGGEAFVMNSFYFTFFDLDQGRAHEAREKATIRGFDSYSLSDGTSLEVEQLGDSSAIFSSSMRGGKVDNPTAPLSLSHLQRERSVVVELSDVSEFSVQLSEENYASSQGRNWFFAGPSSIVCSSESKCSTYECPTGYHTRTMAEFLVCAGSPCTRHDRDTCCYEKPPCQGIEVLSIDHTTGENGKYFNFDTEGAEAVLGHTMEDAEEFTVRCDRTGETSDVRVWSNTAGGSSGDAHGRKNPKEEAEEGDWEVGDCLIVQYNTASPEADLYSKSTSGVLDSKSASGVSTKQAKTKIKSAELDSKSASGVSTKQAKTKIKSAEHY